MSTTPELATEIMSRFGVLQQLRQRAESDALLLHGVIDQLIPG